VESHGRYGLHEATAQRGTAKFGRAQNPTGFYCGWLQNSNHQLIGGKNPVIFRVSTIQDGAGFLPPSSETIGEMVI